MTKTLSRLDIDAYPYPETVNESYQEAVRADAVRKGDLLVDMSFRTVMRAKTGTKWTELFGAGDDKLARIKRDTMISVQRSRETDESRKAYERAESNRAILRNTAELRSKETAGEKLQPVTDYLLDLVERVRDKGWVLDSTQFAMLMETQEMLRIRMEFAHALEWSLTEREDFFGDPVDVLEEFTEELKSRLANTYNQRALSRSSSVMDNLLTDVRNWAMAEFIDQACWMRY